MNYYAISKISIINEKLPKIETQKYNDKLKKFEKIIETNYIVKENEEIIIISSSFYNHKDGMFLIAIGFKNVVFVLEDYEIEFIKNEEFNLLELLSLNNITYCNKTPIFEERIISPLDL